MAYTNPFIDIFKISDLRKRIFFVFFILVIYRIGAHIPCPGIDMNQLARFFAENKGKNTLLDFIDFFAGGAFKKFSLFPLGIMPYITTSIIMQLLMLAVPAIKRISEETGGRRKIQQITRMGAVVVGILQSFALSQYALNVLPASVVTLPSGLFIFSTILTVTTGIIILMWFGEQITERGLGNGISVIIFAGIAARIPSSCLQIWQSMQRGDLAAPIVLLYFLIFSVIVGLVIYEQQGQRKIPVNYAKRVVGRKVYGMQNAYLPFKINPSGVIPIIFASAMISFPLTLVQMVKVPWVEAIARFLKPGGIGYIIFYTVLILFFAYFYTQVTLNPVEIAKNIRENGGSIPGIQSNKVESYLFKILNRITLPGALFLAFIAIIPNIVLAVIPGFPAEAAYLLGGTSLLIMVGVDLDTMSQIEGHLKMHHHDGIVRKGKLRSRNL